MKEAITLKVCTSDRRTGRRETVIPYTLTFKRVHV